MAMRVRFFYPTNNHLGISIERLSDGLFYDFADSTFKATPGTPILALLEDSGIYAGRYKLTLTPTPPAVFTDGDYCITIHHTAEGNTVLAEAAAVMLDGDDATPAPAAIAAGILDALKGKPINVTLPS